MQGLKGLAITRSIMPSGSWAQVAAHNVPSSAQHRTVHASSKGASPEHVQKEQQSQMIHRGDGQEDPLVVSLRFDQKVLDDLTAVRKEHFPPDRSNLEAHLTILHALPADCRKEMQRYLHDLTKSQSPFRLSLGRVQVKPRIVLLPVRGADLNDTVHKIQQRFWALLSDQDRATFRQGHITLCNKRPEQEIEEHGAQIEASLRGCERWHCRALGLDLWVYQGRRPWKHVSFYPFNEHN